MAHSCRPSPGRCRFRAGDGLEASLAVFPAGLVVGHHSHHRGRRHRLELDQVEIPPFGLVSLHDQATGLGGDAATHEGFAELLGCLVSGHRVDPDAAIEHRHVGRGSLAG